MNLLNFFKRKEHTVKVCYKWDNHFTSKVWWEEITVPCKTKDKDIVEDLFTMIGHKNYINISEITRNGVEIYEYETR